MISRFSRKLFTQVKSIVCVLIVGGCSQSANSADLVDIYRLALLNDPTLDIARYTLKSEEERYPQAVAGFLPKVSISGNNNLSQVSNRFSNSPAVERDVHSWNWSLQITQPLIRLQNYQTFQEAKASLEQARAQYNLAEQDVILRVTQAYFGVMSAMEEISVVESELIAAKEQLQLAETGFKKGVVAIADVLEGQSNVDLARSNLVVAKSRLDTQKSELSKIIDVVPEDLATLSSNVVIPQPTPSDQNYWIDFAKQNSPIVRAAHLGLQVAEATVKKARSEHTPTLDLVASFGESYSSGSANIPSNYATRGQTQQIGIQFNVPLYEGGAISSRVAEAIANKYRAGAELEEAIRQAATDARQAYTGVINGLAQIAALESAVQSGLSMVNESRKGYQVGLYNNVKVLDAEQDFYSSKRDLIKARYETLFQALKLKAAVGGLTDQDLIDANYFLGH